MLIAKKKDGSWLSLVRYTRSEMRELKQEEYYCPTCKGRVFLKVGTMKIPHFAHQSQHFCQYDAEGESAEHLLGKKQLWEWLQQDGLNALLEKYFPACKQRADLFVEYNGQGYAIEFQCSIISPQIIKKRTQQYLRHNIIPIWILNSQLLKKKMWNEYLLSTFQFYATTGTMLQLNLLTYSPTQQQFTILQQITPFSTRNVLAFPLVISQQKYSFSKLLQSPDPFLIDIKRWLNKKRSWCAHVLSYANYQDPFFQAMYESRTYVVSFPLEIGLPVPYMHLYETSIIIWQFWVYEKVIRHKQPGDVISFMELKRALLQCVKEKKIILRFLPAMSSFNPFLPLQQYVYMLERLGVLKEIENQTYKVNRVFEQYDLHAPQIERVMFQQVGTIYNQLMQLESLK